MFCSGHSSHCSYNDLVEGAAQRQIALQEMVQLADDWSDATKLMCQWLDDCEKRLAELGAVNLCDL